MTGRARVWVPWVATLVAFALVAAGCLYFAVWVQRRNCRVDATNLGFTEYHWDQLAHTCYVTLPDGRQVDLDKVQFNEPGQVSSP